MRRFRKLLLTLGIAATLLLSFPIAASADPGDGGGFIDPTIYTPSGTTIVISGPNGGATVALAPRMTTSASDPGDGGGF